MGSHKSYSSNPTAPPLLLPPTYTSHLRSSPQLWLQFSSWQLSGVATYTFLNNTV